MQNTLTEIGEDTKYIRLATITMFIHSLIFTIFIIRYAQFFVNPEIVTSFIELFEEYVRFDSWWFIPLLLVWIILAIWYWILPPVWEAALIIYRDEWRQQWTTSLSKWFWKFFPMFEFHAATWLFQIPIVLFWFARMIALWVMDSPLIIALMIIWTIISLFVLVFFPYSKLFITLEDDWFFEAMKKSATLAMNNIWITIQFVWVTLLLSIRFIINIILLIWIPLGIIYLGTWLWLDNILFFKIIFIIGVIGLVCLVAYIEWIIEAFFITCRWKVWKLIKEDRHDELEELIR